MFGGILIVMGAWVAVGHMGPQLTWFRALVRKKPHLHAPYNVSRNALSATHDLVQKLRFPYVSVPQSHAPARVFVRTPFSLRRMQI
jgi:hypothetical protein